MRAPAVPFNALGSVFTRAYLHLELRSFLGTPSLKAKRKRRAEGCTYVRTLKCQSHASRDEEAEIAPPPWRYTYARASIRLTSLDWQSWSGGEANTVLAVTLAWLCGAHRYIGARETMADTRENKGRPKRASVLFAVTTGTGLPGREPFRMCWREGE